MISKKNVFKVSGTTFPSNYYFLNISLHLHIINVSSCTSIYDAEFFSKKIIEYSLFSQMAEDKKPLNT